MTRIWLRRLALGLLGLAVLLAALVAWFVSSFDADRYKGLAIDWMKREHDRTLAMAGPVELSVLPRIEVRVSGLRLSEKGRPNDEFASVREVALAVELLPLLSRQLVIDRIAAKGVHAVYARDAKGRRNIDDLLGTPEKPRDKANDTSGAASPPGLKFDISRIDLEDVRASVRDEMVPLAGDVSIVSLQSGRIASGVAAPVSIEAQLALQRPALTGRLAGETRLTLDVPTGSVAADAMKLEFKGDVPGASRLDAKLRGALAYAGESGALNARDLALDLASASLGSIALADSHLKLASFAFDAAKKSIALDKLQLDVAGKQGADPLAFALDWPQLAVQGQSLKGSALKGRFSLAGTNAIEGRFESGAPAGSFEKIRLPGLDLVLKGKNGPRQIDGQLKTEVLLEPEARAASFDRIALQAKVQEPSLAPLALAVNGSAKASAKSAAWKLDGKLNENAFSSDGSAQFASTPKAVPDVQAQARFDSLDLNKLLPASNAASAPAKGPSTPEAPIDLSALRAVNGKFSLRANRFALRQYRVADAKIDATLNQGTLRIPTLQGKAFGGIIDASGFAEAGSNKLGVKLAGSGVDVNALLKDVASFDRLEGTGKVTADVQSAGRTVTELRRAVGGSAALQLRDGAIKGVNLAKVLRQAKAALSMKQDATQRASQTEKTDFSELSASFRIADGVARNDDLDMKSPFLRLGGAGAIDIGRGRIDYTARATVIATPKGQDAGDLGMLKGLTVPVKLSGPFEAVDWSIQWSAVAAGALKNELKDRLGEALGNRLGVPGAEGAASSPAPAKRPEDLVKDRLKGVFGR
jgi:AsmA protein